MKIDDERNPARAAVAWGREGAFNTDYMVYETSVRCGASVGADSTFVCGVTPNENSIVAAEVIAANVPACARRGVRP